MSEHERVTDAQINGLFENLDASDVPAELRKPIMAEAWLWASCWCAGYYVSRYMNEADSVEMGADWAAGPADMTGLKIGKAEEYAAGIINAWRNTGKLDEIDEPWSWYEPDISPARQRRG